MARNRFFFRKKFLSKEILQKQWIEKDRKYFSIASFVYKLKTSIGKDNISISSIVFDRFLPNIEKASDRKIYFYLFLSIVFARFLSKVKSIYSST